MNFLLTDIFAIVDETQDLSVPQVRFLASPTACKEDGLLLADFS